MTRLKQRNRSLNRERFWGLAALILIALAWYAGGLGSKADVMPVMKQLVPQARQFQILEQDTYAAWKDEAGSKLLGYVKIGRAMGYGGPLTVAIVTDKNANIIGIGVVDHKDTPTYFERVIQKGLIQSLLGKSYEDDITLGHDVDGVSGATKSSYAITEATRQAVRNLASNQLKLAVPDEKERKLSFGLIESILLILFALGILARRKTFKYTRTLRWICLLTGLLVLGFVYDSPLTISMINQFLLGFWPDWHTSLYTYLLVAGVMTLFLVEGKNPYCRWFCPFGAAQECIGKITNAKSRRIGNFRGFLKWLHRIVTLSAIVIALLFRSPGLSSYEVFGALFKMWGSAYQFIVIAMVLFMSLYTLRPWCNYLCPIRPVEDYLRMIKKWIKENVKKK